jgi:hypothetical protein
LDAGNVCRVIPPIINLLIILCGWCFPVMSIASAQWRDEVPPSAAVTQSPRSAAGSEKLAQDILQRKVPLTTAATRTISPEREHEERPFHRKPKKGVLVDSLFVVAITAASVAAALLLAQIRWRRRVQGRSVGPVTVRNARENLQFEILLADVKRDAASEAAREESCQLHKVN